MAYDILAQQNRVMNSEYVRQQQRNSYYVLNDLSLTLFYFFFVRRFG